MNNIQIYKLVNAIASIFNFKIDYNLETKIAIQVMLLPDNAFKQLFVRLSLLVNINSEQLIKLFVDHVIMMQLWRGQNNYMCTLQLKPQEHRFKLACTRTKTQVYQQFQDRFATALKNVLYKQIISHSSKDYSELCKQTNTYFLHHNQMVFWKHVNVLIPERSCKQLRDYYQKSFLRNMYVECISGRAVIFTGPYRKYLFLYMFNTQLNIFQITKLQNFEEKYIYHHIIDYYMKYKVI
ncbi:Hypothetical_protein [Hexamita inflata]|uniref:Hypothetical_protein n=1 Tax=Hexamita inflata TaxID=28002 RepID=A0AA86NSC4_9EUKA|nr:Hypothetical protein HINF_LOCUS11630 [Hexamita inflata]